MKFNVKREAAIGLSILLLLLIILGTVAIRRFMRRELPPDEAIAKVEEKSHEEHRAEPRKPQPELFPKPVVLTPVETPRRDSLQPPGDPGRWNGATKEKKKEAQTVAKLDERENERTMTRVSPEPPPMTSDERYASVAVAQPMERETKANTRSMVVAVSSGEMADGAPRPLDRNAGDRRPAESFLAIQPGPGRGIDVIPPAPAVDQRLAPHDGAIADMPPDREAARLHAEKARTQELRGDAAGAYGVAPPRYGYDATAGSPAGREPTRYAGGAPGDAAAAYPAAAGGYAPDNSLRRGDEVSRMPPQVRPREDGMYEVQPNDSYWTISERVYGSGAYFRALAELNRGKAARPDRLQPGLLISTPPVAQLEKDYPDYCPRPNRREAVRNRADQRAAGGYQASVVADAGGGGRTYVVQEGDTLSSIARNELGKVSRWAEIYQLNRAALGKDYDYLTPGMRLALPMNESPAGDRTTRRSDGDVPLLR